LKKTFTVDNWFRRSSHAAVGHPGRFFPEDAGSPWIQFMASKAPECSPNAKFHPPVLRRLISQPEMNDEGNKFVSRIGKLCSAGIRSLFRNRLSRKNSPFQIQPFVVTLCHQFEPTARALLYLRFHVAGCRSLSLCNFPSQVSRCKLHGRTRSGRLRFKKLFSLSIGSSIGITFRPENALINESDAFRIRPVAIHAVHHKSRGGASCTPRKIVHTRCVTTPTPDPAIPPPRAIAGVHYRQHHLGPSVERTY